jgi:Uma2 family endonuclease
MAAMRAEVPRVSYAELQEWPDDGRRYELYDGEVIAIPSPIARHQRVVLHVTDVLVEYERGDRRAGLWLSLGYRILAVRRPPA